MKRFYSSVYEELFLAYENENFIAKRRVEKEMKMLVRSSLKNTMGYPTHSNSVN